MRVGLTDPHSYDAVFDLAERHGLTIYDAAYLDLALREGQPLASLDARLRKAAAKSGVILFEPQE
jgi:predicted nucleic acid-binding protein